MSTIKITWTTKVTEYHEVEMDEAQLDAIDSNWRAILDGDDDNNDPADWLGNIEGDDEDGQPTAHSVDIVDRYAVEYETKEN